jgi:DNA-binding IclR family transcriptional regulator
VNIRGGAAGTQSIDRAVKLLLSIGRAGPNGARPADLGAASSLPKPTVRRLLKALVSSGLVDQDAASRRYYVGPETYVLGLIASARFGIHAKSVDALARLSQATGDTAFLSVPRDTHSVCLHREEGSFPIRTHVLQPGDRHPLGIGAGSLAILAAFGDDEVQRIIDANTRILATEHYRSFRPSVLRRLVAETRSRGYAFNPGMLVTGSCGVGVAVLGANGAPLGALSIAAIEQRLNEGRRAEILPLLRTEAAAIEQALQIAGSGSGTENSSRIPAASRPTTRTGRQG